MAKEKRKGFFSPEKKAERKKKRKLRFLKKEQSKSKKNKKNYRSTVTQYGSSGMEKAVDTGVDTKVVKDDVKEKEVFYKTKGTDAKQQAKVATTGSDGKTSVEAVSEKTKGGDYKVYGKESKKAGSFRDAFAGASKAGKSTFMWNGLKYSTQKA